MNKNVTLLLVLLTLPLFVFAVDKNFSILVVDDS